MNKTILLLGIVTVLTACAGLAKADSDVSIERATVVYTLRGASHIELYHDALLVCAQGRCEAVIDDVQSVDAWVLDSRTCTTRAQVWVERLDEPLPVVACDVAAGVIEVVL